MRAPAASVYSLDLRLSFDSANASLMRVELGALVHGWSSAINTNTPGLIRASLAGAAPVGGSGELLRLSFAALLPADPRIEQASVNEGSMAVENLTAGEVVGRWVAYRSSAWDAGNEDNAIASDKVALSPGVKGGFANYTSYTRGLNGVVVDVLGLPGEPTTSDFAFRMGNTSDTAGWAVAPAPASVTVRRGAGTGGSDRIALTWGADAVRKRWLEVRVRATAATGLAAEDVFYFGNAVGEAGNRPGLDAIVNATDELLARQNPRGSFNPAPIHSSHDYNRDKLVNATDQLIARANTTSGFTALQLITPSGATGADTLAGVPASDAGIARAAREASLVQGAPPGTAGKPDGGPGMEPGGSPARWVVTRGAGWLQLEHVGGSGTWCLETSQDPWPGNWRPVGVEVSEIAPGVWRVAVRDGEGARFFRASRVDRPRADEGKRSSGARGD